MSSKVHFNKYSEISVRGGENQTHDLLRPISDALTTKLLEALWRPGSEFTIITTPVIDGNHSSVFFTTEKRQGMKSKEEGSRRKEKKKSRLLCLALNPNTISPFCFLHMPKLQKLIFCIWIRRR